MRCFKAAFLAGALMSGAAGAEHQETIEALRDAARDAHEQASQILGEEMLEVLQREPGTLEEGLQDFRQRAVEQSERETAAEDTGARAWSQIEQSIQTQSAGEWKTPPHPAPPEDVVYVYISLSMPASTIKSLFLEALDIQDRVETVFVLRGWDRPGPNRLVARLNALFPEAEKLGELPNVQINPVLFRNHDVELVPTFARKDEQGEWQEVVGVTTIEDAIRRISRRINLGTVVGTSYQIEEPDILELIEQQAAKIDWEAEVDRIRDGILTQRTTGRSLPHAVHDDSYLVDLTITNNQDLAGPQGDVFATAGQTVNPLDYITLSQKYVFIDANEPRQVEQALAWKQAHGRVTIISTLPVTTLERRQEVFTRLGQQVFESNDLLLRRFQIREVPAIAYQEGRMLRIDIAGRGAVTANEVSR